MTVPPNTTAEVVLPDGSAPFEVGSGRHSFRCTIEEPQPVEKPQIARLLGAGVTSDRPRRSVRRRRTTPSAARSWRPCPPFPPLTAEAIPFLRAGAAEYMPRPTNEELSRGGSYSVEERVVPVRSAPRTSR